MFIGYGQPGKPWVREPVSNSSPCSRWTNRGCLVKSSCCKPTISASESNPLLNARCRCRILASLSNVITVLTEIPTVLDTLILVEVRDEIPLHSLRKAEN